MCPWKVVFNVTHYMDYHPGGWDELVRGAGRDATDMFNEIHRYIRGLSWYFLLGQNWPYLQVGELPRAIGGMCSWQACRRRATSSKSALTSYGTFKKGYVVHHADCRGDATYWSCGGTFQSNSLFNVLTGRSRIQITMYSIWKLRAFWGCVVWRADLWEQFNSTFPQKPHGLKASAEATSIK